MATEKRLIDANAIDYPEYFYTRERHPDEFVEGFHQGKIDAINDIKALAPTVDAVEVVHGWWIEFNTFMTCSECDTDWYYGDNDCDRFDYCPQCGAKMDGDGNG